MTRAYSNKALPAGTVLREWRLEEVLGVGGFGIVYKARGIYFNELVAIKEYFPSSISDREPDDTVVPIDSDSEEVHALGLKKFVEEAKLLWNLSSPSRHPNIVSVRSLFEIHGTAYMVMDFEDGVSLSRMLKQGRRFNERSLWNILRPIAEGLDRAHRVGVLHRDIKPPNILINEDNRPVLIDFGSARFEAAEATSTTVTFHTPPYAAIEQYVKTYEQGPWTDVYALGVVMYECVTGEKPPEVLERLHGGLGKPLASGKWPGYSKPFLAAIDAAMTVKPEARPQSMSEWLAKFGKRSDDDEIDADGDDEATRFFATQVEGDAIAHVPGGGDADPDTLATGVPSDPKQAKFRRVGEEISQANAAAKAEVPVDPINAAEPPIDNAKGRSDQTSADGKPPPAANDRKPAGKIEGGKSKGGLIAAAALGVLALGGSSYFLLSGGKSGTGIEQSVSDNLSAGGTTDANPLAVLDASNYTVESGLNAVTSEGSQVTDVASEPAEAQKAATAKEAAAKSRMEAAEKVQRKAAAEQQRAAAVIAAQTARTTTAKPEPSTVKPENGVSRSKQAQFYSIVDDARSQAKQVMRSKNSQNAQLARTYDSNLKALRDSFRGVRTDDEADRLIKQATQTRAYIRFLVKQE